MERIDLNALTKDVLSEIEHTILEKKAKITIRELPQVWGVYFQIRQLFLNLLSNSLSHFRLFRPLLILRRPYSLNNALTKL